ncbi:unnamed protein product [Plutella xylostella]|uniref:(diamondback moth) hypothetical protein n=1 Tax=Plutella xylostella TaxID=51655 RepID=A0A8S4GCH0_PLUXY|nr:unnamed protein product [Plutella xylostella]
MARDVKYGLHGAPPTTPCACGRHGAPACACGRVSVCHSLLPPAPVARGASVARGRVSVSHSLLPPAPVARGAGVRLWQMQYAQQWKCVAVLAASPAPPAPPAAPAPAARHTAYLKMAAIANPAHMPKH